MTEEMCCILAVSKITNGCSDLTHKYKATADIKNNKKTTNVILNIRMKRAMCGFK